jgi:hypothetical protein
VSHHRQRRRLEPTRNQPYPAPTKNYPNASLNRPPKDKDGTLTNGKSTSDDESEKDDDSSSSDDKSEKSNDSPSSEEESEKSEHSSTEFISIRGIMNPDFRSV